MPVNVLGTMECLRGEGGRTFAGLGFDESGCPATWMKGANKNKTFQPTLSSRLDNQKSQTRVSDARVMSAGEVIRRC